MSHFPERRLKPFDKGDKTRVIWARRVPTYALVFVHGYRGHAIKTWSKFDQMLPARNKAQDYDLFFYGYNCTSSNTTAESTFLCDFLNDLFNSPSRVASDSLPREAGRGSFSYQHVVLVGHSIGAIICRRALLFARDLKYGWMPSTRLVFFAPANNGATISELLKEMSWFRFSKTLINYNSPLINEVAKGSSFIIQLNQDVINAFNQGAVYLKAKRVVIAQKEKVVDNNKICVIDPNALPVRGTTHTTVCKPRRSSPEAVDHVESEM
jgi:pimeloyl-ACP methyl ester carboxylesterase